VKFSSHLIFWLSVWMLLFIGTPMIISPASQMNRIKEEIRSVNFVFGTLQEDAIVSSANKTYKSLFLDTGILIENNKLYTKNVVKTREFEDIGSNASGMLSSLSNGYLHSLSINIYGLLIRWGIFLHWSIFILPFIVAAFIDGFVVRKIKFTEFGFISPMAYSFSIHVILFLIFIPLAYLVAPIPISAYFMPVWALIIALPINMLVGNTQRLFAD